MKKNKYMAIDLLIFLGLMFILEGLNLWAVSKFNNEVVTLSIVTAITLIVIMRWGAYGLIHSALGGLFYCVFNNAFVKAVTVDQYVIYIIGNLFIAFILIFTKFVGKQKIRDSVGWTILYCIIGFILVDFGRAVVSLFFTLEFGSVLLRFLSVDALNCAITIVIMLVARKQNGVFEDQIHYLNRISMENKDGNK